MVSAPPLSMKRVGELLKVEPLTVRVPWLPNRGALTFVNTEFVNVAVAPGATVKPKPSTLDTTMSSQVEVPLKTVISVRKERGPEIAKPDALTFADTTNAEEQPGQNAVRVIMNFEDPGPI